MGGYMVCDVCKKYYNLQPGELPVDFTNKCNCGGNYKFTMHIKGLNEDKTSHTKKVDKKSEMTEEDKQFWKERQHFIIIYNFKDNFQWFNHCYDRIYSA
jgi:hypothetical protein